MSQKSIFLWQAAANILFYGLLWTVQVIAVYLFTVQFASAVNPEHLTEQTIFLAFYRSKFLHGLLPLDHISIYLRNIILIFSLGICAAVFPIRQRKKELGLEIIVLAALTCILFPTQASDIAGTVFMIVLSVCLAAVAAATPLIKEDLHETI